MAITHPHDKNLQDANLTKTIALPSSDGTAVTAGIDTGDASTDDAATGAIMEIVAPALTVSQLPNAGTATYHIEHSTDNSSFTDVNGLEQVAKQTGASSAGADAETVRIPLPAGLNRYIRLSVTTASAGNASGASMILSLKCEELLLAARPAGACALGAWPRVTDHRDRRAT